MESTLSPSLPFTSDPALHDDWEEETLTLPSSTNSDDLEALHQVQRETKIRKNKLREVIQHRAWPLEEAFRSEADHSAETPLRSRAKVTALYPASSPVRPRMSSSPVTYPSSPPAPIKRSLPQNPANARKSKAMGGFLLEDDSEGDNDFSRVEPAPKRRMLETSRQAVAEDNLPRNAYIPNPTRMKTIGGFLTEEEDDEPSDQTSNRSHISALEFFPDPAPFVEQDSPRLPSFLNRTAGKGMEAVTCSGRTISVQERKTAVPVSFENLVAARSTVKAGRAKTSYYGIDIHQLIDEAKKETEKDKAQKSNAQADILPSVEHSNVKYPKPQRTLMWTEKYRARTYFDLCGDERTHRQVMKWVKKWDPIVFPKSKKAKPAVVNSKRPGEPDDEKAHRKILLLTGPPGLGKTTLAHVCARQAGYEVMEINASDERSSNVVKGRIRTSVGTESVKTGSTTTDRNGHVQKVARPLCVVVDEVDGVVGGSGGSGEGGFIKALIDLILLDQKNSSDIAATSTGHSRKKKKGDDFRQMRPLILICNDVYHPSLRPLRQSNYAEIIHVRKCELDTVVNRMKFVFEKERVPCDADGVRKLCEATWGISAAESRQGREGAGEGDIRGILVVGEWAARKLRASKQDGKARLTRKWVEENMTGDLGHGGGGARGVGRGGTKELVKRVFLEGAGFPKADQTDKELPEEPNFGDQPITQLGVGEMAKRAGMERLREMVDTSGDIERIVTEIFADYPNQPFNDDSTLSKPNQAYEWLHFHDICSKEVFTNQSFELTPYLSQPILACHHLFSSSTRRNHYGHNENKRWGQEDEEEPLPFSGPRADYEAFEAQKINSATLLELQSSLNPDLLRGFRSPEDIATDLLPYLVRMLTPAIKPIVVGGSGDQRGIASVRKESEKAMVRKAVEVMGGVGVVFERGKLEGDFGSRNTQWVYRMEPALDALVTFETATITGIAPAPVRYAVRQVLDQEYQKNIIIRENSARQARYKAGNPHDDSDFSFATKKDKKNHHATERIIGPVKDFFGRAIVEVMPLQDIDGNAGTKHKKEGKSENKVWVSFHEGFSNAVRKPITIEELMRGL